MKCLRLLFVKEAQSWPRGSGHDVHGYHMMQALAGRGHAVSLAAIIPPTQQALEGLSLAGVHSLETNANVPAPWTRWQRRFTEYFGVEEKWAAGLADLLNAHGFDAVIVVARHLLPLMTVVKNAERVWYPADDPAWHHLSRVKVFSRRTWGQGREAAVNALYERAFRSCVDRVWVVSPADRAAMRWIGGYRQVDLIPNGVDADHYQPGNEPTIPESCVFWGRLDFGPNVDALRWFVKRIWPPIRAARPAATFHLFGFNPTEEVRELVRGPGIELHPDLPDLREEVRRRQVVVLPFMSGGGIKNKLLEAAALGMPVVCTRKALSGTRGNPPMRVAKRPGDWLAALGELWDDPAARAATGAAARQWVIANHTWAAASSAVGY